MAVLHFVMCSVSSTPCALHLALESSVAGVASQPAEVELGFLILVFSEWQEVPLKPFKRYLDTPSCLLEVQSSCDCKLPEHTPWQTVMHREGLQRLPKTLRFFASNLGRTRPPGFSYIKSQGDSLTFTGNITSPYL